MPTKVIGRKYIIVGASSGIGFELTRQLADQGAFVAALARRADRIQPLADQHPGRVFLFAHDVTDTDSIPQMFQLCTDALGGLDGIIYASGVMPDVGPHEYSTQKDLQMVEVNIKGLIAWLNCAAARMEGTKYGSIVAIGSVAGERGRQAQPVYNASKAFLHTYLEALRNRLAKHGVKVVTIKPGPVQTEMTAHLGLKNAMSVHTAARKIIDRLDRTGEHFLSPAHAILFAIIRNIPSPIFKFLKI
jgi:NADP-dependent 3-hydroxy acid dehydrogenase YdfG